MNMIVGNALGGGLGNLTGGGGEAEGGEKTVTGEDPEVVQARIEQEERRQEKHRKMEAEREKMRKGIRDKYNIKKKDDCPTWDDCEGRIGAAKKKTPEELAAEGEDDGIIGQLGLGESVDKAKQAIGGVADTIKGFLPFGK